MRSVLVTFVQGCRAALSSVAEGVGLFLVASYVPRTLPRGITMRPSVRDALPRTISAPMPASIR